jgi:ATP-dependent Clp protease ATP-binding subunit ClpB
VEDRIRLRDIMAQEGTQVAYLLGPPGAGKTALVEAVAAEDLKGKEVIAIDLGDVEANTQYRGSLEGRFKAVLEYAIKSKGQVVLFFDEFKTLMSMEGVPELLKPAMARGEVSVIAATTLDEYRASIEKDKALTSRAQVMDCKPMSPAEALEALRARKPKLQAKYGLTPLDSTLKQVIELAARYYPTEPLSRKSLQIVEETMSRVRSQLTHGSKQLRILEDQLARANQEAASLRADLPFLPEEEKDIAQKRITAIEEETKVIQNGIKIENKGGSATTLKLDIAMREMHRREGKIQELNLGSSGSSESGPAAAPAEPQGWMRKKFSDLFGSKNAGQTATNTVPAKDGKTANNQADLIAQLNAEVRQLREIEIPKLRAQAEQESRDRAKNHAIQPDDVKLTVAADRNVPINGIGASVDDRIKGFRENWEKNVFGQDHVEAAVERSLSARLKGLEPNQHKPIVYMFNGSTGVGKTAGAKIIAASILNDPNAFLEINMGQYQGEGSLWTLLGAAKGHVSVDEGGVLTEHIRQKPFSVVLLDEFHLAYQGLENALLVALESGKMRDGAGREVDLRNTIFILNTNITDQWAFDRQVLSVFEIERRYGFSNGELAKLSPEDIDREVSNRLLQKRFSKPFLGRIDLKITFRPIDFATARTMTEKELKMQKQAVLEKQGVRIETTDAVIDAIARIIENSPEGGRQTALTRKNIITEQLLVDAFSPQNGVSKGQTLNIDFEMNESKLGGSFKIAKTGQVLKSVQVVFPVRLSQASQAPAAMPFEKAMRQEEAATTKRPEILNQFGKPARAPRARGR